MRRTLQQVTSDGDAKTVATLFKDDAFFAPGFFNGAYSRPPRFGFTLLDLVHRPLGKTNA